MTPKVKGYIIIAALILIVIVSPFVPLWMEPSYSHQETILTSKYCRGIAKIYAIAVQYDQLQPSDKPVAPPFLQYLKGCDATDVAPAIADTFMRDAQDTSENKE